MMIELREITSDLYEECIRLKVHEQQNGYVASNEASLKQAKKNEKVARPFAIFEENQMVGFTMFAFDEENDEENLKYWLWRFMIEESLQGKGYGKAALKEIIRYFENHGADKIALSTVESNEKAIMLYEQMGFRRNGEMNEDETVFVLEI